MANRQAAPGDAPVRPGDPIDLDRSVAGEEDPGASIDLANLRPAGGPPATAPGDQAPAGTPGTGENVCPACGGSGRQGASSCTNCQGTGRVTAGIGGG